MKFKPQFFTSGLNHKDDWVPIDHFFFAPYELIHGNSKLKEKGTIVCLEGSGDNVYLTVGEGKNATMERCPGGYPQALRRMADVIEQFEKDSQNDK